MTQFLLARPEPIALPAGFAAEKTTLADAAAAIFGDDSCVWEVRAEHGALDAVCDEARAQILAGAAFERTRLGEVLVSLIRQPCELAMFWGGDFTELPAPAASEELMQIVAEQLTSPVGNWEVYVRWSDVPAER